MTNIMLRTAAAKRFPHRRTQSLSVPSPTSYGFILLPQTSETPITPAFTRRHSETSPRHAAPKRTPSPAGVITMPDRIPVPSTPTRRASFDRMMLVNPAIAAHLKRGGAVNMRTPGGLRRWRVKLGVNVGGLQGVIEEADKSAGSQCAPMM
jgi:hypothetical protein